MQLLRRFGAHCSGRVRGKCVWRKKWTDVVKWQCQVGKDLGVMKRSFRKTSKARFSSNVSFFIVEVVGISDYWVGFLIMRGALVWIFGRPPVLSWYRPYSVTADSSYSCVVSEMYSDIVGGGVSIPHPPSPTAKSICGSTSSFRSIRHEHSDFSFIRFVGMAWRHDMARYIFGTDH